MHEESNEGEEWLDAKTASERFGVSIPRLHELAAADPSPLEFRVEIYGRIRPRLLFTVSSLKRWNASRIDRYRKRDVEGPGRLELAATLLIGV